MRTFPFLPSAAHRLHLYFPFFNWLDAAGAIVDSGLVYILHLILLGLTGVDIIDAGLSALSNERLHWTQRNVQSISARAFKVIAKHYRSHVFVNLNILSATIRLLILFANCSKSIHRDLCNVPASCIAL